MKKLLEEQKEIMGRISKTYTEITDDITVEGFTENRGRMELIKFLRDCMAPIKHQIEVKRRKHKNKRRISW